jgi:hypothetical protein
MRIVPNPTPPHKFAARSSVNEQAKIKAVGFGVFYVDDSHPHTHSAFARQPFTGTEVEPSTPGHWRWFSTLEDLCEALGIARSAEAVRAEERREHEYRREAFRNLHRVKEW